MNCRPHPPSMLQVRRPRAALQPSSQRHHRPSELRAAGDRAFVDSVVHAVKREVSLLDRQGRGARARRRNPAAASLRSRNPSRASNEPRRGDDSHRRRGRHPVRAPRDAAGAREDADDLPGPVRLAQPAPEGPRHRRRAAARAVRGPRRGRCEGQGARGGAGAARAGGAQCRACRALSAPVLRRAAPAHRHRPGALGQPRPHHRRRAGLGAGRLDPGADPQPDDGPARRARPRLPLHQPRPLRWCTTSPTGWA